MSQSVVADFTGRVSSRTGEYAEPVTCRVVMSESQLVVATDDQRRVVPLSAVFDVAIGRPPGDVAEFFDDSVTVAYRSAGARRSITVQAASETVDRFGNVLFTALLEGTPTLLKYRARAGGRVTGDAAVKGRLHLEDRTVVVRADSTTRRIDVDAVVVFDRTERRLAGTTRPAISVRHVDGQDAITSEVALPSERTLNVLGRYLRLAYTERQDQLAELSLTDDEAEVLVARYTSGDGVNLASVLGIDSRRAEALLGSLVEKGLLTESDRSLTSLGLMIVDQRLEAVN